MPVSSCPPASLSFGFVYMNCIDMCKYFYQYHYYYYYVYCYYHSLWWLLLIYHGLGKCSTHEPYGGSYDIRPLAALAPPDGGNHWAAEPISGNLAFSSMGWFSHTSIPSGIPSHEPCFHFKRVIHIYLHIYIIIYIYINWWTFTCQVRFSIGRWDNSSKGELARTRLFIKLADGRPQPQFTTRAGSHWNSTIFW